MIHRPNDLSHAEIRHIVKKDNPIIVEVGSNDGSDTLEFLKNFQNANVHCFECEPRAIKLWRDRVLDPRATLYEFALDEEEGIGEFFQSGGSPRPGVDDWHMSGSLAQPTGHLQHSTWCKFDNKIVVCKSTLDHFARDTKLDHIDFLWIDVQGVEMRVLKGATEILKRTKFVKLECHATELYAGQATRMDFVNLFKDWEFVGIFADDLLFHNRELKV